MVSNSKYVLVKGKKLRIVVSHYQVNEKATAVQLVDAETEEQYATISVNLRGLDMSPGELASHQLPENQFYANLSPENMPAINAMLEARILVRTYYKVGYGNFNSSAEIMYIN